MPQTTYPLVYQVFPGDPATYYIQAVIRLSSTNKVWQTVNLTNSGNNRYIGAYTTPSDGYNGVPIDITYYVYTDSGYSVLSQAYDTKNVEHLVLALQTNSSNFSGGNDSLSKEDIAEVLEDLLLKKPVPKELSIDEEQLKFQKIFEPLGQSFHDSLTGIYDKQDGLEKGIKEMRGSQGRNKNRLNDTKKELVGFIQSLMADTKKELSEHFQTLITDSNLKSQSYFNGHQTKLDSAFKEIKEKMEEKINKLMETSEADKKSLGSVNRDKIKKIKKNLAQIMELEIDKIDSQNPGDYKPEEVPIDYLSKAKKLMGI